MSTISRVWRTALKLGCITNFDMPFLMMGFISLVDDIQFMLISSRHICIRSIPSRLTVECFFGGDEKTIDGSDGTRIGDFRVAFRLCFKESPSAKP